MKVGVGRDEDIGLTLMTIVKGRRHVELASTITQVALRGNVQVATWMVQLGCVCYMAGRQCSQLGQPLNLCTIL